jgi:ATP phosphoribosyltransferase regulatory subunit
VRVEPPVPAQALAAIRAALATAGAEPVDAPMLQPLNLLLDLAGEAMRARLFVVQAGGGVEECLRPDFTVAVARQHIERGAVSGRYIYEGPAFRASPGGDRPEQIIQLGVEMVGPSLGLPLAVDTHVASLAWNAAAAGGRSDLTLWLGDVALFSAFIESLSLPEALAARLKRVAGRPRLLNAELARAGEAPVAEDSGQLAAMLSGLSSSEAAALLEEVWALAGVEPVGGRGAGEIAARLVRRAEAAGAPALTPLQAAAIGDFMAISTGPAEGLEQIRAIAGKGAAIERALANWQGFLSVLQADIPAEAMRFAPALGHAFDYYDGLTFEVRSAALGDDRPVASGGRYDGLLARLGGSAQTGAVGCVVRPWRAWSGGEA